MIISAIHTEDSIYIKAHAEQSYTGTYLADKGDVNTNIDSGIYGSELTRETLTNLVNYVKNQKEKRNLIIDFKDIKDVQSNQRPLIVELKDSVQKLILTNVSDEIIKKLSVDIYTHNKSVDGIYEEFYVTDHKDDIPLRDQKELFNEEFVKRLKSNVKVFSPGEGYKHTSPIYLPTFINIKGMLVDDTPFFIYIIYHLAKEIRQKEEWMNHEAQPVLFCQNLNGAFIASVLSSFLKLDLLSMDHIGPVNKVYTNIGSKIKSDARYIVVSDMVCLGTEVRICQNIINYSGGKYIGNVSIVKIDTLIPDHQSKDAVSVFNLSKENNPINFEILTALTL